MLIHLPPFDRSNETIVTEAQGTAPGAFAARDGADLAEVVA